MLYTQRYIYSLIYKSMRMEKTSTPKLRKQNFEEKVMRKTNKIRFDSNISLEANLKYLLDKELINPRNQIIEQILDHSKKTS